MSNIIQQLTTWFFEYALTWQFVVGYVTCIFIPMPFLSNVFLNLWSCLGAWFVRIENRVNANFTNLVQTKINTLNPQTNLTNPNLNQTATTGVQLPTGHVVTTVITTSVSTPTATNTATNTTANTTTN